MKVTVTTAGIEKLTARVSRVANFLRGGGMKAVMAEHGSLLIRQFQSNILSQTPGRVADLKDSYKERKLKKYGLVYPILYASGGLFNSMGMVVGRGKAREWTLSLVFKGRNRGVPRQVIGEAHLKGTATLPKRDFARVPRGFSSRVFESIRRELRRQRERE